MDIRVKCRACSHIFTAPEEYEGRDVVCPECRISVPATKFIPPQQPAFQPAPQPLPLTAVKIVGVAMSFPDLIEFFFKAFVAALIAAIPIAIAWAILMTFLSAMARAEDADLSAFQPAAATDAFADQSPATLGRPGVIPDHLGPLWAEHLKQEKSQRLAENRALDERRHQQRIAAEQATAKATEDALFRDFTKMDGSEYGEHKIKCCSQGTVTLVDRDGGESKISRSELGFDDQSFVDEWVRSRKPEIRHATPKTSAEPKQRHTVRR